MGDWPAIGEGNRSSTEGEDSANSRGTLITSGAANTKGNYSEIAASTPFDAQGLLLTVQNGVRFTGLIDVAVGAGGSEQVILPNFLHAYDWSQPATVYFPIPVPAASRVAIRSQASFAAQPSYAHVTLLSQGFLPGSPLGRVDDWGTNTGTSRGTEVDPGGTIHTKGAYSELVASTTFDVAAIVIVIGGIAYYRPGCRWLIDVAVGAAESEQITLPDLGFCAPEGGSFYGDIIPKMVGPLPVHIPAGTRIAARAQCNNNVAGYRVFDIAIYGIG